jgi:hypothetical protein
VNIHSKLISNLIAKADWLFATFGSPRSPMNVSESETQPGFNGQSAPLPAHGALALRAREVGSAMHGIGH